MTPPPWLQKLFSAVCHACVCDVKGRLSGFSFRWSRPDENAWGAWLLVLAPAVLEILGGEEDGAMGFDFVDVDLVALPRCLDAVESFCYDPDYGDNPRLRLVGQKGKRDVVIEVSFAPFADDEPDTVFDVNQGSWREKRPDTEFPQGDEGLPS
jgi:hypothetical protein